MIGSISLTTAKVNSAVVTSAPASLRCSTDTTQMFFPTFTGVARHSRYAPAAGRRKSTVLPWVTHILPCAARLWPPIVSAKATRIPPWTVPYCCRLLSSIIMIPSAQSRSVRIRCIPFSTAQGSSPRILPRAGCSRT